MASVLTVVLSIIFLIVGILIGYIIRKNVGEKAIGSAEQQAQNIILDAQNTVENLKNDVPKKMITGIVIQGTGVVEDQYFLNILVAVDEL